MRITAMLRILAADERGGEVTEYALILGLIAAAAVTVVSAVGCKVLSKWQSTDNAL